MNKSIMVLCMTAASIGFLHTVLGPDHYLPFIVMSKARNWSKLKTSIITILCGIGHVASSIVLGAIGIFLGIAVMRLEVFEAFRGNLAAWAFIGFGFMYFVWGIRNAIRNKPHVHLHAHENEEVHSHKHAHLGNHAHVHSQESEKKNITPWVLFTIFVLGPREPLIPILMYPASKSSFSGVLLVASVFGAVTVMTMLSVVMLSCYGLSFVRFSKLERYAHAIAGATICVSGLAIQFLGL